MTSFFRKMPKIILFSVLLFSLSVHENQAHIKAIIFDLDGTIVDTEQFWFSMLKKIVKSHEISLPEDGKKKLYNAMLGNPIRRTAAWMIQRYNFDMSPDQVIQEYHTHSLTHANGKIDFVPGFQDFFKKVRTLDLKFAIASNCDQFSCDLVDKAVNLESMFGTHIYNIRHVQHGKPAPDVYFFAARQIEMEPHECIVIEDSATGIRSAKNAGMLCIGLNRGNRDKVKEADIIVDSYADIPIESLLAQ